MTIATVVLVASLTVSSAVTLAASPVSSHSSLAKQATALTSGESLITAASVEPSPFSPDGNGVRERVFLSVTLGRTATLTVRIHDFHGRLIRTVATSRTRDPGTWRFAWDGRNDAGALVRDGPYRFSVRAVDPSDPGAAPESRSRHVAKSRVVPYPLAPGSIVVSFTAGHGGPSTGAPYDGLDEKDVNLEISLKLRDMLEASGVVVPIGRTTDTNVNVPQRDVNGDGEVDLCYADGDPGRCWDELQARNDIPNLARADLTISLHNNASTCHCARGTSMYTSDERTWTPEGIDLARAFLQAHLRVLVEFTSDDWEPHSRGVNFHRFYAVKPYDPPKLPRPALMPAVLSESTFGDHPVEGALLQKRRFRTAIAVAFYEGITRWLRQRAYGMRYEVLDGPTSPVLEGGSVDYGFRLTNTGNTTSSAWSLEARYVPAVPLYDGSPDPGTMLDSVPVADGLAPGESMDLSMDDVPAPPQGEWLVKFDVVVPGDGTLGFHGVVGPQLPLTVTGP